MLESDNIDLPSFGAPTYFERVKFTFSRRYQKLLDDSSPYVLPRWIGAVALLLIYVLRVSAIGGYFIVSYALGIYLLNLLIGFLSPQVDPEEDASASSLPLKADDEFKPFVRRYLVLFVLFTLFLFALIINRAVRFGTFQNLSFGIELMLHCLFTLARHSMVKALTLALFCTFIRILDIPVFWPILVIYFLALTLYSFVSRLLTCP